MARADAPASTMLRLGCAALLLAFTTLPVAAEKACLPGNQISKWEAIGGWRLLMYKGDRYLAFVDLAYTTCPYLQPGQKVTLRFFSPSICPNDPVVVNGRSCSVDSLEYLRQR